MDELEHLKITCNIDTFMIRDSDFFLNLRRVKELSNLLIERDLGVRLTSVNGRMEQLSKMSDDLWSLDSGSHIRGIRRPLNPGCGA
ncbi:MAG: hypothetical protein U9N09_00835 [Euryarchaeota archaeon]|nr:hypothetical protein [Euryarchaeota archaeon]